MTASTLSSWTLAIKGDLFRSSPNANDETHSLSLPLSPEPPYEPFETLGP